MKVDHIAFVVPSLDEALQLICGAFGLPMAPVKEYPALGIRASMVKAENIAIELIEPTGPGPYWGARSQFVNFSHLALDENSVQGLMDKLKLKGITPKGDRRRTNGGSVQDLEPNTTMGLRIQLINTE